IITGFQGGDDRWLQALSLAGGISLFLGRIRVHGAFLLARLRKPLGAQNNRFFHGSSYSVETVRASPFKAARGGCQASVAHLTRTGNSRTPVNTVNFPSWPSSGLGAGSRVSNS